jgi:hypothetical protein
MRRFVLVTAAAALLVAGAALPAAAAPAPVGNPCTYASTDAGSPGTQNGVLFGGPLVLTDDTNPAVVYSGTLTCTAQYGIFNSQHSDGGHVCATSGPTTGVVVVAEPVLCSFPAPGYGPGWPEEMYVCAQLDLVTGGTLYYQEGGGWTTNANTDCVRLANASVTDETLTQPLHDLLDPLICPVLAVFFPPEGDVGIFWDCPPYNPSTSLVGVTAYFTPVL